jgi:hypothetical protein
MPEKVNQTIWKTMRAKNFTQHLIRTIQNIDMDTKINTENDGKMCQNTININFGIRRRCPLSPVIFNMYADVTQQSQQL